MYVCVDDIKIVQGMKGTNWRGRGDRDSMFGKDNLKVHYTPTCVTYKIKSHFVDPSNQPDKEQLTEDIRKEGSQKEGKLQSGLVRLKKSLPPQDPGKYKLMRAHTHIKMCGSANRDEVCLFSLPLPPSLSLSLVSSKEAS